MPGSYKKLNVNFITKLVINGGMNKIDRDATDILAAAVIDCPVLHGHMRGSANKIRDDNSQKVFIGFGKGISGKYTRYQHNNVALHHKVGKAKWLQDQFDIITSQRKYKR